MDILSNEVEQKHTRTLVISGVNMTEGGILSVLREVVSAAENVLESHWRIVVLAHRKDLLNVKRAEVIEFPFIKASWLRRMWFELVTSRRIAGELRAEVWLAMHDITPLVNVDRQYVYCHNPTPFTSLSIRALYFDRVFVAFSLLYGVLYSLNIRRNREVFVQQAWIRDAFILRFGARSVVVARPMAALQRDPKLFRVASGPLRRWIYPTFPRHFKNVEIVGEALALLESDPAWSGEVLVTIDGSEGRYARYLRRRFGELRTLRFVGRQDAIGMKKLYEQADGLLFPSKLETWGLPITEAQSYGLPILVADLDYARETVGNYDAVTFFNPTDALALAALLHDLSLGKVAPGSASVPPPEAQHTLFGWDALVRRVCL